MKKEKQKNNLKKIKKINIYEKFLIFNYLRKELKKKILFIL